MTIVFEEFMSEMTDVSQAVSFKIISNTGGIVQGRGSSCEENERRDEDLCLVDCKEAPGLLTSDQKPHGEMCEGWRGGGCLGMGSGALERAAWGGHPGGWPEGAA